MAASSLRLHHQLTSSLLQLHKRSNNLALISSPSSLLTSFLGPFRFYSSRDSSSSVLISDDDAALSSSSPSPHPWPEWGQFDEKMRSKGYYAKTQGDEGDASSSSFYSDLDRMKHACMDFARERYDIISSLPKEDIQTVVKCGCPNLFKKVVNSAKRLRAFLRVDEADVCSACNLRGSCDRAYVIEKDDNAKARTVDVMRILMSYAMDPTLHSGGASPLLTECAQVSARKLLGELTKLSDTVMDPILLRAEVHSPSRKESFEKSQKIITKGKESRNVEMLRGDWICSSCNFLNFARNLRCMECKADGPKRVDFKTSEMKLGDWTCPKCEFMNFARNRKCFRCQESRPKRDLPPGDWECPRCLFHNFQRNTVCKKCECERPAYIENAGYEDHALKNPRTGKENEVSDFW